MSNAIAITKETFQNVVLDAKTPVLVDFWAPWCGPCRTLGPIIDELAKDYAGRVMIGKINVDEQAELAAQYGIMSIPSVFLFSKGEVVDRITGVRAKQDFVAMIEKALKEF